MDSPEFKFASDDEGLQVFFSSLVEMETDLSKEGFAFIEVYGGKFEVLVSLPDPILNNFDVNHTELFLL